MTRLPPRPTRTGLHTAAGVASALFLLALLGGVPAALYQMADSPLPDHIPTWTQTLGALSRRDNGELFLATLTVLAWVAWALLAVLVTVETAAQLRGRSAPRLPSTLTPVQHGISLLVASILALTIPTTTADRAEALPPPVAATAAPQPGAPDTTTPPAQPTSPYQTYVVQHRDTLWGIAEHLLGEGHRYGEIAALNYGITQPDGRTLGHDHHIWPGWTLRIPTIRTDSPTTPPHVVQPGETLSGIAADELGDAHRYPEITRLNAGRPQPDGHALLDPDLIRPGWRLTLPDTPPPSPPPPSPTRPTPSPHTSPPPTPPAGEPSPVPSQTTAPHGGNEHHAGDDHGGIPLPSGAIVGMSLAAAITAALTTARLHRRRNYRPGTPGQPRPEPPPPPSVRALERASRTIGAHTEAAPAPAAGLRGGTSVNVETLAIGGAALTGPGAHGAVRALLVACLAHPHTEVVITSADLQVLLDNADTTHESALAHLENLVVVAGMDEALALAEAETTHRMRLLDDADPDSDLAALRRDHPDEPLPTLLMVTATDHPVRNRLGAILAVGQQIGIGAILTGDWTDLPTYTVEHDGHLHQPTGDTTPVDRLFHLPPTDATDLLGVLAAARGAPTPNTLADTEVPAQPPADSPAVAASQSPRQTARRDEPVPVRVNLFGGVRLFVNDQEVITGLRTASRELLLYLALHPAGAGLDQVIEELWPDDDSDTARETFHAAARTLRKALRDTTRTRADFLLNNNGRYRLNPDLIDVDLWALRRAARAYTNAASDNDRTRVLTNIAEIYTAELAEGLSYAWLHSEREAARREALDALTALAQIQERRGQPERAIATLEAAIRHDPCGEELYRRIMNLHAGAGRTDAARRIYRLLRANLRDIAADPEPETEQLVHSLRSGGGA